MTAQEKYKEIKKLSFMIETYESCWFMDWDVLSFVDSIQYLEKGFYYKYFVQTVENNNGSRLSFNRKDGINTYQSCSFEEIFESLSVETREKIVFYFDLFKE